MKESCPYDLVIGLDRSDRKADLHFIDTHTGRQWSQTIATKPEALHAWLAQLRQRYSRARVGLGLEQPAVALVAFLETCSWITLHAINPSSLPNYRQSFVTSRAKDDTLDELTTERRAWFRALAAERKGQALARRPSCRCWDKGSIS